MARRSTALPHCTGPCITTTSGWPTCCFMTAEEVAAVAGATPVGRWGGEQEIATAVLALIDTNFITGETLRVDGGRHIA